MVYTIDKLDYRILEELNVLKCIISSGIFKNVFLCIAVTPHKNNISLNIIQTFKMNLLFQQGNINYF